ncbi:type II toxin-antitoxin system RelE/ParE family toxin [Nitrosomonas sp.]|uniref:type II toxin-antitoxin system RelE/ParE family toxin n=1 Tax=Nitrosomonas sp. TaxID=42353 RepID=UPI00208A3643|nr:type II toxin-antitoxin system RelE/ParE family toxin [Nitrosomonas sp.]GJL76643.1 MAG: toxin ParE1 [Nitrosomonas sp.]
MSSLNNYELLITDPARDDLEAIAVYSFIKWGEERTNKYTEDLYKTITNIANNPDTGKSRYGVPKVIKGRKSGHHVIFYRIVDQTIFVMRILHESMDHGRHF